MKKENKENKEKKIDQNLIEALLDLVAGGILIFIWYIVDPNSFDIDPEILILFGLLLVLVVLGIVDTIKRKKKKNSDTEEESERKKKKKSDTEEESEKNERDYFFEFDDSAD